MEKHNASMRTDLQIRVLLHLFMLSTVINGGFSHNIHRRSPKIDFSTKKRTENSIQIDPAYHYMNQNKTIQNGSNLLSAGFDKMLHWVFDVEKGPKNNSERSLGFGFGEKFAFRKRLQFALLPIMYKMGVMTTLLTGLTVLAFKGLTIGVILLIFALGNYFTKLHKHANANQSSQQPIHVHVHSQDGSQLTSFPDGVGPWDKEGEEVHPNEYLRSDDFESYRQRLIDNSEAMVKLNSV